MFAGTSTTCFWTYFCAPGHSPRCWAVDLRRPGTSPARPTWATRSGPARIQRGEASRYHPVGAALQKIACPPASFFCEPVSVPMFLRDALGFSEESPGRMDEGKGKQRASIAAPWPGMGLFSFCIKIWYRLHGPLPPTPHSLRPTAFFWHLQVEVDPGMSSPLRKMQAVVPWASSGVAVATDAASVSHLPARC